MLPSNIRQFKRLLSLGQKALESGDQALANNYWAESLKILPEDLGLIRQLIHLFRSTGQISTSENIVETHLKIHPNNIYLCSDKACLLLDSGLADKAADIFISAYQRAKGNCTYKTSLQFLSNAIMALEYSDNKNHLQNSLIKEWVIIANSWIGSLVHSEKIPFWTPKSNPFERKRIGFVSGDFCNHPVGFLALPLIQNIPPDWTPYVFNTSNRCDSTFNQLKTIVPDGQWYQIGTLNETRSIQLILSKNLDVLIDLSGHTAQNSLYLMAHRLAKKQLSWLGFSSTIGLPSLDGVILDDVLSTKCENLFVEQIFNLNPSRFCFRPPYAPQLSLPPCLKNGYVTFGSFNNTSKYNEDVLTLWASILKSLPTCKLILKWRNYSDIAFRKKTLDTFNHHGVSSHRIELRCSSSHRRMLDEYNDVDIALDPFPFNGGFTSLEALWMGLPLVTLFGLTPIGRQSASFLHAINKKQWVAYTHEEYLKIALSLASDPSLLSNIRANLRYDIMDSPLYDASKFSYSFFELINTCISK